MKFDLNTFIAKQEIPLSGLLVRSIEHWQAAAKLENASPALTPEERRALIAHKDATGRSVAGVTSHLMDELRREGLGGFEADSVIRLLQEDILKTARLTLGADWNPPSGASRC